MKRKLLADNLTFDPNNQILGVHCSQEMEINEAENECTCTNQAQKFKIKKIWKLSF